MPSFDPNSEPDWDAVPHLKSDARVDADPRDHSPNLNSPLLAGLNEPQQQAVLHESGPVLIFAGAGSGKTNALTKRIAYLIRERYVRPYNILAVTFTNQGRSGDEGARSPAWSATSPCATLWAGTFHSLCARCLREAWNDDRGWTRILSSTMTATNWP